MLTFNLNNSQVSVPENFTAANAYPVAITAVYMDALTPNKPEAERLYQTEEDETYGGIIYTIPTREALYQLILHLSERLTEELSARYAKGYGAPADDETYDIDSLIDLLRLLNELGTRD